MPFIASGLPSARNRLLTLLSASLLAVPYAIPAYAADEAAIQSSARPFGLDIAGPVYASGSDTQAGSFNADYLPVMNKWIAQTLGETKSLGDISSLSLDPSKLNLATASDVRVYFVGEGAAYQNTLGYNTDGATVTTGDPTLIFPNASSNISYYNGSTALNPPRTTSAPLLPGDFVDLGTIAGGTQLDFFMIADGASGGKNVYSTDAAANPDGINHVVAYAIAGSPYLLIGFEDMKGGGDRDFNDLLFAVDIGAANVTALTTAPEPPMALLLVSFLLPLAFMKKHVARSVGKLNAV